MSEQVGIVQKIYSVYLLADKFYEVNKDRLIGLGINIEKSEVQLNRLLEYSVKVGIEAENKFKNTIEAFTYIKKS